MPDDKTRKIPVTDLVAGKEKGGKETDSHFTEEIPVAATLAAADRERDRETREIATPAEARLRVRMSAHDAHYGGGLVDGARMLGLFGDVATELLIRIDGDEGLFRAYESVEFLAPVYAGDYIEAVGKVVSKGTTSRKMSFEAFKVIAPRPDLSDSAAEVLPSPLLVCRAVGTCVVPSDKQRFRR